MEQEVSLKPFLKKGLRYSIAEVLYRYFFQPIDNLLERLSTRFTRKFIEKNDTDD